MTQSLSPDKIPTIQVVVPTETGYTMIEGCATPGATWEKAACELVQCELGRLGAVNYRLPTDEANVVRYQMKSDTSRTPDFINADF